MKKIKLKKSTLDDRVFDKSKDLCYQLHQNIMGHYHASDEQEKPSLDEIDVYLAIRSHEELGKVTNETRAELEKLLEDTEDKSSEIITN